MPKVSRNEKSKNHSPLFLSFSLYSDQSLLSLNFLPHLLVFAINLTFKTERYIYMYIYLVIMRSLKIENQKLELKDDVETIFQKKVTIFGNGAKIDCRNW